MKKRNLILILIVLLLLGSYLLVRSRKPVERSMPIFSTDSLSIGSIEIGLKGKTLKISRRGEEWWLTEPVEWKADDYRIKSLFSDVLTAKIPDTIMSSGSSAVSRYNLDDNNALHIKVYDQKGKQKDHVLFGNAGAPHDYLRFGGKDDIYLIKAKVAYQFEPDLSYWRDPKLLNIQADAISRIEVKYSQNAYTLLSEPKGWRYRDSNHDFIIDINNRQMIRVINILSMLETRVFIDNEFDSFAELFVQPHCEVMVHLKDKKKLKLSFGRREKLYYLMIDDNRQTLFEVTGDTLDRFTRSYLVYSETYGL